MPPLPTALALLAAIAAPLLAQTPLFPIKDLRAGMRGVGKTVFQGTTVETFDVEILGVLENVGPKQSIILGRLSGGPLEKTGVMQGMSGSPVYIDGKLVGAVAMAFAYAKEPIAGIRPIGEMLAGGTAKAPAVRARLTDRTLVAALPARSAKPADEPVDMLTPVSFAGFTSGTLQEFGPQLRALGLEPRQGLSGGRATSPLKGVLPQPGSMISVQLARGDMAVGADGTVTHVDGKRLWAFGHRFLSIGATELPFAPASVMALMPNVNTSFKISASGEPVGIINADNNASVSGVIGAKARMAQVNIAVQGADRAAKYHMEMVQDRVLSPLLVQMMLYSALDASERTLGSSTVRLRGAVKFEDVPDPVVVDNMYAGDYNVPLVASLGAALPIAYALQNSVDNLKLQAIDLTLEAATEKKQLSIEQVWASRREVRPGETIEISTLLAGDAGREVVKKVQYEVPIGAPVGTLGITVSDGPTANATDQKIYTIGQPRPVGQVVALLNSLRGNTKAYIRLWRSDPTYTVEGQDLPDPPPSVSMILGRVPGAAATAALRTATVAEIPLEVGESVVSGSKTIQVEVKE